MPKVSKASVRGPWLRRREIGYPAPLSERETIVKGLYEHFRPCLSWRYQDDPAHYLNHSDHGGILHLDFSLDGELLVAACEKNSILMFDPLSHNLLQTLNHAHNGAVNSVKFLDSRTFATCSDDSTVALWDSRYLKSRVRTFRGHKSWVKNIEYSSADELLITSGFDGSIYTWDINKYYEKECPHRQVFNATGLVRTCLTPDCSKLIISTRAGYMVIIHNLKLDSLAKDLNGFKPNMYRIMQLSKSHMSAVAPFTHLFSQHRKTNRLEFVSDFPPGDDAEIVSSVQVHPYGFCMVSRNVSYDENSEWTCVHDLRECSSDIESCYEYITEENVQFPESGADDGESENKQSISVTEPEINLIPHLSRTPATQNNEDTASVSVPPVTVNNLAEDAVLSALHTIETRSNRQNPWLTERRVTVETNSDDVDVSGDEWPPIVNISNPMERIRIQLIQPTSRVPDEFPRFFARPLIEDEMDIELDEDDDDDDDSSLEGFRQNRVRIMERNFESSGDPLEGIEERGRGEAARVRPSMSRYAVPFFNVPEDLEDSRNEEIHIHPSASQSGIPIISRAERLSDRLQITSNIRVIAFDESTNSEQSQRRVEIHCVRSLEQSSSGNSNTRIATSNDSDEVTDSISQSSASTSNQTENPEYWVHQNIPRLSHYVREPNVGRGLVKGLSFSPDGRIICSPFGFGIRLLSFNPDCADEFDCSLGQIPIELHEFTTRICHKDFVLSSKFSPKHCFLVSGCLNGKMIWHQPVL